MLDHVSIPVQDVEASVRFYLDVFAALGLREALRYERDGPPVVGLSGPPEYHPTYDAVFLRDLDGNNVEAICRV